MIGYHWHKCPQCGRVWRHSNDNWGNMAAHSCTCGLDPTSCWWPHYEPSLSEMKAFMREARRNPILFQQAGHTPHYKHRAPFVRRSA